MRRLFIVIAISSASALFAQMVTFTKYVPVQESMEMERFIVRDEPIRECWDEEVPIERADHSDVVGALIGGAAGGIIGHQIGGGNGKTVATIGGTIIGTLVGKNLAERSRPRQGYEIVKRCRTRYEERRHKVVEYKNIARVMGRQIVKYSDRPLRHIPVKVTIEY